MGNTALQPLNDKRSREALHRKLDRLLQKYTRAKDWAMVQSLLDTIHLLMERGEI